MNQPTVSIILPTYNRAKFLPEAFGAIAAQAFTDWELIVVDDGSTDDTRELVPKLTAEFPQPVRYIYQENQGAYGARNTGLDHATGKYIAFYDSDDLWLPHHLKDCVEGLEANPDVDWACGASRIVDLKTGRVVIQNTFYDDALSKLTTLQASKYGTFRIITDDRLLESAFEYGVPSGLQNSVIRSALFSVSRFRVEFRHECEDRIFLLKAIANGHRIAYSDSPHVEYRVHAENASSASTITDVQKSRDILVALINARERLKFECRLSHSQMRALNKRLSSELFWQLGYSLLWLHGRQSEALGAYQRALRLFPWNASYWKTYLICRVRAMLNRRRDKTTATQSEQK